MRDTCFVSFCVHVKTTWMLAVNICRLYTTHSRTSLIKMWIDSVYCFIYYDCSFYSFKRDWIEIDSIDCVRLWNSYIYMFVFNSILFVSLLTIRIQWSIPCGTTCKNEGFMFCLCCVCVTRHRWEKSIDNRDTPCCKIARPPSIRMDSNSKLTKQTNKQRENRIDAMDSMVWLVISIYTLCWIGLHCGVFESRVMRFVLLASQFSLFLCVICCGLFSSDKKVNG